jgi:hypothetical protein
MKSVHVNNKNIKILKSNCSVLTLIKHSKPIKNKLRIKMSWNIQQKTNLMENIHYKYTAKQAIQP